MAPSDAARMITSSAQPKRNAVTRPHASRMNTYIPPVCGYAPDSSASVSAPHSANSPPATHTDMSGSGPGSLSVMPAGERKIPEPIVDPTRTATALQSPSWRVREGAGAPVDAGGLGGADIREGWSWGECHASPASSRCSALQWLSHRSRFPDSPRFPTHVPVAPLPALLVLRRLLPRRAGADRALRAPGPGAARAAPGAAALAQRRGAVLGIPARGR